MLKRWPFLAAILSVIVMVGLALGQIPGTNVFPSGTIIPGNCAKWITSSTIGDAGKVCAGAGACSNSFDFSQACNSQYLGGL